MYPVGASQLLLRKGADFICLNGSFSEFFACD